MDNHSLQRAEDLARSVEVSARWHDKELWAAYQAYNAAPSSATQRP